MTQIRIRPTWVFYDQRGDEVEPRLFELLRAIREHGRLTDAARAVGLSYRHAWHVVGGWTEFFGQPLVTLEKGRGARLTALGEKFLWAEERIRARFGPQMENFASELDHELRSAVAASRSVLRVHASHGYAVSRLRELAAGSDVLELDVQFKGSVESLAALARGHCDVAGFHVPIGALTSGLATRYLRHLRPDLHRIILLVERQQGLMVAPGNPKKIRAVADLARADVRFVNRQQGSGTRALLEQLLSEAGVDAAAISDFEDGEFTHAAVAAHVAAGIADAGFGVEPAARQFRLDFLPVVRERYMLATRADAMAAPPMRELLSLVRSRKFLDLVADLPGYFAAGAGRILSFADVFGDAAEVPSPRPRARKR